MTARELEHAWAAMSVVGGFRRIDLAQSIDWYIGLNEHSLPSLMLMSDVQPPSLHSSSVLTVAKRRRVGIDNRWTLLFDLTSADVLPVFAEFCASLINSALRAGSAQTAIRQVVSQYHRWEALFRRGFPIRFTETQRRALLSQLLYLKKMIASGTPFSEAVQAWVGPQGSPQDFRTLREWAVVKAHASSDTSVDILSLRQLDAEPPGILALVHLDHTDAHGECVTLGETINELYALAEAALASEAFAERLAETGYIPSEEADVHRYFTSGMTEYYVDERFPRLLSSNVPPGIFEASYRIDLSAITDWQRKR